MSEFPTPPRRSQRRPRKPPRPRALSRDAVVDAALRIIDAEGVDAVTMRRVGEELGTGGASLYAHVADKEELLDLVFDRVVGQIEVPEKPDPRRWEQQLAALLTEYRNTLLQHRDLARLGLGNVPVGPNALRGMESMLAILDAGKLPPHVAAFAADLLAAYVVSSAYEYSLFTNNPQGHENWAAELHSFFTKLPPEQFPTLVRLADELAGDADDGDQRFQFGLEVIIRGLSQRGSNRL